MIIEFDSKEAPFPTVGCKEYIFSHLGFLSNTFSLVSKYLVSPKIIDKLYPPSKREVLSKECIKKLIGSVEKENYEKIFKNCKIDIISKVMVMGLYLRSIPYKVCQEYNLPNEPSIFLCPDRIANWAMKVSDYLEMDENLVRRVLTAAVTFHELAHAYMDGKNRKNFSYAKIIEESLANATAFELLSLSLSNRAILRCAFSFQPIEYAAYTFWQDIFFSSLRSEIAIILKFWKDDFISEKNPIGKRLLDFVETCSGDFWKALAVAILKYSI